MFISPLTANCQDYCGQILEALGFADLHSLPMLAAHVRSIRSNSNIPPNAMGATTEELISTVTNLFEDEDLSNIDYIYSALTYHLYSARNKLLDDEVDALCHLVPRTYKRLFKSGKLPGHFIPYTSNSGSKKASKPAKSPRSSSSSALSPQI